MIKNIISTSVLTASLLSSSVLAEESDSNVSFGVGVGIPYAVIGVNMTANINEHVDISAAIGTVGELAWSAGAHMYPLVDSDFRASMYYGTNGVIRVERCHWTCEDPEWEGYTGLSAGLGWGTRGGESGFTADLILLITSGAFDEADKLEDQGYDISGSYSRVKIALGYQF